MRSEGDIVASKRMIWLKFSPRSHLGCTVDNGADQGRQGQERGTGSLHLQLSVIMVWIVEEAKEMEVLRMYNWIYMLDKEWEISDDFQ